MTITLTADSGTVSFADPYMVSPVITRTIQTYNLSDGAIKIFNRDVTGNAITIEGIQTSDADSKAATLHTISDSGDIVTLSGMYDTNLNGDYKLSGNSFKRDSGETGVYHYTLVLEKIR